MQVTFNFYNASGTHQDFIVKRKVNFMDDPKVEEIIDVITEMGVQKFFPWHAEYFPVIDKDDWLWVLEEQDHRELLIIYKDGRTISVVDKDMPASFWIKDIKEPTLVFRYFPTRKERAKGLILRFNGDKEKMKDEGVLAEYLIYDIDEDEAEVWVSEKKRLDEYNDSILYSKQQKETHRKVLRKRIILLLQTGIFSIFFMTLGVSLSMLPVTTPYFLEFLPQLADILADPSLESLSLILGISCIIFSFILVFLTLRKLEKYYSIESYKNLKEKK